MKRKLEILTGIILLCSVSGFIYYEYTKPACLQDSSMNFMLYTTDDDQDEDYYEDSTLDGMVQNGWR